MIRIAIMALTGLGAVGLAQAGHYHLADGPPSATPAPVAPANAPAHGDEATAPREATAPSPAESAVAAAAEPAESKTDEAANEKRLYAAGYKPEMQNGIRMWCRKELTLGSRLAAQKNCGTADSLGLAVQQNQRQIDEAQRKTGFYPKNEKFP